MRQFDTTVEVDCPAVGEVRFRFDSRNTVQYLVSIPVADAQKVERDLQAAIAISQPAPNPAKEIAALVELSLSPPVMGMGGGSKTEEVNIDRWKQDVGKEVVRLREAYGGGAPAVDWIFDSLGKTFGV